MTRKGAATGILMTCAHVCCAETIVNDGRCKPYQPMVYVPEQRDAEHMVLDVGAWQPGMTFESGQAELTPYTIGLLNESIQILKQYPDMRIEVAGHTDSIGTSRYNQNLSVLRAKAAYHYLLKGGVNPSSLTLVGYGETRPIAPNQDEHGQDYPDGRCRNRRVEINPQN